VSPKILIVDEKHKCQTSQDMIILSRKQNKVAMVYASTIARHTELELPFVLNEVYDAIQTFCKKHTLPCFASYNDREISIKLQIIDEINEIVFNRLKPLVNEKALDYALTQALYTVRLDL
jgi:hypothetical protein